MLKKVESVRKAVAAFLAGNVAAAAFVVFTSADFSSREGIMAFVLAEVNTFAVYFAPANKPKKP